MEHLTGLPRLLLRCVAVGAGGLLAAAVTPTMSSASAAAPDCSATVVDAADVLDDATVAAAIERATSDSEAPVSYVVLTYTSVPGGDLDAAVDATRNACPDWVGNPNDWRRDRVALAVSVQDRTSGFYYGPGHRAALGDDDALDAVLDRMEAGFGDGDWTRGMTDGIAEAQHEINTEGDLNKGLVAAVGVPVTGGVGYGGYRWLRSRRRRREEIAAARAAAQAHHDAAAGAFLDLEQNAELYGAQVDALPASDDTALVEIRTQRDAAVTASTHATQRWIDYTSDPRTTRIDTLDAEDAQAVAEAAEPVAAELLTAVAAWNETDRVRAELVARVDALPAAAAQVATTNATTRDALRDLAADGFHTDALAEATVRADALAARAVTATSEQQWGAAVSAGDEATSLAKKTLADALGLRALHADLTTGHAAATTRAADVERHLLTADEVLSQEAAAHHSETVADLPAQLAAARQHLGEAQALLVTAGTEISMQVQQFARAGEHLAAINSLLDRASDEAAAPENRRAELVGLRSTLPATWGLIGDTVTAIETEMSTNGAAMRFLPTVPATGEQRALVQTALAELAQDRPRLLTLRSDAEQATARTAADLNQVRGIVAQYRQALSALESAGASLRDATEAAQNPRSGGVADAQVRRAAVTLREAQQALSQGTDLAAAIALVQRADAEADSALGAARAEIQRREQAERAAAAAAARRQRSSHSGSGGSSRSRSRGSGGGGGSRRSSGGGGSRRSGGGSRRF